jgi:hypothetical protein
LPHALLLHTNQSQWGRLNLRHSKVARTRANVGFWATTPQIPQSLSLSRVETWQLHDLLPTPSADGLTQYVYSNCRALSAPSSVPRYSCKARGTTWFCVIVFLFLFDRCFSCPKTNRNQKKIHVQKNTCARVSILPNLVFHHKTSWYHDRDRFELHILAYLPRIVVLSTVILVQIFRWHHYDIFRYMSTEILS